MGESFTEPSTDPRDIRRVEVVHLGATRAVWRLLLLLVTIIVGLCGTYARVMQMTMNDQFADAGKRIEALEVRAVASEKALAGIEAKLNFAIESTHGVQAQIQNVDAKLDRLLEAARTSRMN